MDTTAVGGELVQCRK